MKNNEMRDNRPIGRDFDENNVQNQAEEFDFDEELYEFKSTLEQLNRELEEENE